MKTRALYLSALVVAGFGAALIPLSLFVEPLRAWFVYPMIFVSAAAAVALFLRMLFDRRCRRGIDAVNAELRGRRWIKFSDPEWGLFGSRTGTPAVRWVRAIVFLEFVVLLPASGASGSDVLILAFETFGISILLSLIHAALNPASAGQ